jgi:hypothetical protein
MERRPETRFEESNAYHYSDFELLMKIAGDDACMQACLKVITSTCLAHGIGIECESGKATEKFTAFVQRHYILFCEDAVRSMFTCGFVPWRLRKLDNGAFIPETIPLGTFVWSAESNGNKSKSGRKRARNSTEALSYKIRFIESLGMKEEDVEIYTYIKPMGLHAPSSLRSPLSSVVEKFRLICRSLARIEYADEWNTQAKMICSYASSQSTYTMNEGNPIIHDWSVPQNRDGLISDNNLPVEMEQNVYIRQAVTEKVVEDKDAMHAPMVSSFVCHALALPSVLTLRGRCIHCPRIPSWNPCLLCKVPSTCHNYKTPWREVLPISWGYPLKL